MIQKILRSTNPKLREKSKKVEKIDKKILNLIADLRDTLKIQKDPEGVGLAAPQIGRNLQVFLASYKGFERIVINPKIVEIDNRLPDKKKVKNEILEGCLSLPNYYGPLRRARGVTVKYMDEKGAEVTEKFDDFNAQIILHEIDHLNGILFVDHLLQEKKPLYRLNKEEWEEVELV